MTRLEGLAAVELEECGTLILYEADASEKATETRYIEADPDSLENLGDWR